MKTLLLALALLVTGLACANTQIKTPQEPSGSVDPCLMTGEGRFKSGVTGRCGGVWNIYASIPNGDVWYADKMGADPVAKRSDKEAKRMQERVRSCGIEVHISLSRWFDSFSPNLVVVHSSPHPSAVEATEELRRMKVCRIEGYSKKSDYSFAGSD